MGGLLDVFVARFAGGVPAFVAGALGVSAGRVGDGVGFEAGGTTFAVVAGTLVGRLGVAAVVASETGGAVKQAVA